MKIKTKIISGEYIDSVTLMLLTTQANAIPEIKQALIGMGSDMNKEILDNLNIQTEETKKATSNDLMIVVMVEKDEDLDFAFSKVEKILESRNSDVNDEESEYTYNSQEDLSDDESGIIIISVPGQFAVREANIALDRNQNVMLFSDNISVEDEIELKNKAISKDLLLMGPDCGTAIINGAKLCFANEVRDGDIGIIAASGTGAQEVSVKIHEFGGGISQLIGVGGRDLSDQVNGLMTLHSLKMLKDLEDIKTILVISKAPGPRTLEKVLKELNAISDKKVIICFMGSSKDIIKDYPNLLFARDTKEAASLAVGLKPSCCDNDLTLPQLDFEIGQDKIVGVFAGGTLCDETFFKLKFAGLEVYSNNSKDSQFKLNDPLKTNIHKIIDFGADEYTKGKPHPMIDPSIRNDFLNKISDDKSIAVVLLDFVLGYGSNPKPVEVMLPAINEFKEKVKKDNRNVAIIAYVLGTEEDFQDKRHQIELLKKAGVIIVGSSIDISQTALKIIKKN